METEEGLTTDWAMVKGDYSRFDKRREWSDEGTSVGGLTMGRMMEEILTRSDEATRRLQLGPVLANVVEGPFGGAIIDELTRMVRDLQIAQARRGGRGLSRDQRPPNGLKCMWCDSVDHI